MSDQPRHSGILVGVDGSACSELAAKWAAQEAAMRNSVLTVVHVAYPAIGAWAGWGVPAAPLPDDVARLPENEARRVIDDAIGVVDAAIDGNDRVEVDSKIYWSSVVPTLLDLTREAQMIVVGCHGQGALARTLLGSVSTALVHHANCPVAVIHDQPSHRGGFAGAPVLVGVDGSPASELATAIAFDEASRRGVDLIALHAWSDRDERHLRGYEWSGTKSAAEETLAERLSGWQERYPDVTVRRMMVFDYPARHLLDKSKSAQLVVVGSRGRGGFAGMMLGSVSTAVVHAAQAPVIVARQR
jgi:nucleotide-binding universal stress UspA family protein